MPRFVRTKYPAADDPLGLISNLVQFLGEPLSPEGAKNLLDRISEHIGEAGRQYRNASQRANIFAVQSAFWQSRAVELGAHADEWQKFAAAVEA